MDEHRKVEGSEFVGKLNSDLDMDLLLPSSIDFSYEKCFDPKLLQNRHQKQIEGFSFELMACMRICLFES